MLLAPIPTISNPAPADTLALSDFGAATKLQIPSPIGQPFFSFRVGAAESDKLSYYGGISYSIPLSAGVHLMSIRGDADIWEHFSGQSGGGTALGVNAIFGPNSGYFGAGIAYSARINHASGPEGPGVKILFGSQPIPIFGYEADVIVADRGVVGALMATFHF